jgi:ornithine cyclodeaminase/alanine dehydrogenase-like protein (mu-crystallin family)
MPLTVLTDSNVKEILDNLTKDETEVFQQAMRNCLHEYATASTASAACAENQPNRTVIESANGKTTLFMPSTSSTSIGMKGLSFVLPLQRKLMCLVVTLPGPSTYSANDIPHPETGKTTPQGALTLMAPSGKPFGFVNAEAITAFRTALASSLLMIRRTKIKTITVFGTGQQAFWHVRLALLLRGSTIKKVHFFNRDFNKRSTDLLKHFYSYDTTIKQREGWQDTKFDLTGMGYGEVDRLLKEYVRAADMIICTTPSTEPLFDHKILTNAEGRKRPRLIIAIGSYKPHMIEVPAEVLVQAVKVHGAGHHFQKRAEEGGVIVVDTLACLHEAGELVNAKIEAYETVELGELVMLEHIAANPNADISSPESSTTPTESSSPRISLDGARPPLPLDAGKSIALAFRNQGLEPSPSPSGTNSKPVSRKSSFSLSRKPSLSKSRSLSVSSQGGKKKKPQTEAQDQMCRWLSGGNVIYKSVGMGLMDLVIGGALVKMARAKGVGTTIPAF